MDQGNSTETPEINSDTYGQLIFNTEGKNIQKRKDSLSVSWENRTAICPRMKLEHYLTPYKNKLKIN